MTTMTDSDLDSIRNSCDVYLCVVIYWKVLCFLLKRFFICVFKGICICALNYLYLFVVGLCICVLKGFVCVFKGFVFVCSKVFLSVCWKVSISREGQWTMSSPCWNAQNLQLHRVSSSNCCTRSTRLSPDIWFHCQPSIAGHGWQLRPSLCKCIVENS